MTDTTATAQNVLHSVSTRVMAVVLTFNANTALARCLGAIEEQSIRPERVLVIDNASTVPASDVTDSHDRVDVLRMDSNEGPAGGYAAGLSEFARSGYEWAWLLDDDCVPAADCLERLVGDVDSLSIPAFGMPVVVDETTGSAVSGRGWHGALIPGDAVRAVGVPLSELFYWVEDTEYFLRLERAGYTSVASSANVSLSRLRDDYSQPAWKYYYRARNSVWGRLWLLRPTVDERDLRSRRLTVRVWRTIWLLARLAGRILIRERHDRLSKLAMVARGFADGVTGRLWLRVFPNDYGHRPNVGSRPLRVLLVIDRFPDLGGAEGSTALILQGHGDAIWFSGIGLYGVELRGQTELEARGARFWTPRGRSLFAQVRCACAAIRTFSPDLVHSTLARSDLVARLACAATRTPLMTSIVNMPYSDAAREVSPRPWKLEVYRRFDSLLARRATDAFHAISYAAAEGASVALNISVEQIRIVERGRDRGVLGENTAERRAHTRAALGISDDHALILNVARQDHQKGQELLIDAFATLASAFPQSVLVIAGRTGTATRDLLNAIERHGLESRIRLVGVRKDVPDLLCAADVFAFSSLYEGLGGALLEAMALGTPIVAFDIPAVREAVGDAAILVPLGDTKRLAGAIEGLLNDPKNRAALATRGSARFESHYTGAEYVRRMVDLYRDTIASVATQRARQPTK